MESLFDSPLPSGISPPDAAAEARERFKKNMNRQESIIQSRAREKGLPRDKSRRQRALEAIMLEARRMAESGLTGRAAELRRGKARARPPEQQRNGETFWHMEVPVKSKDGIFIGRIDRAEYLADGVRIIDFKSALRSDLPERYERQLQMYAWLWHEQFDEWPNDAFVFYPFTGKTHAVDISPRACNDVAKEAYDLYEIIGKEESTASLGMPGDVCQVCEYRPWCGTFWDWQATEKSFRQALDRAYFGLEGQLTSLVLKAHNWRAEVAWRQATVVIVAPEERFPQLRKAKPGDTIRLLEARLKGQMYRPRAMISERTELYILR